MPNIPPRNSLNWKNCISSSFCKGMNVTEGKFCKIKDSAGSSLVRPVCYWLWTRSLDAQSVPEGVPP